MKKLCSLLLVICLIFSLSACGDDSTANNENGSYCVECGEEISSTDKFCGSCGASVNKTNSTDSTDSNFDNTDVPSSTTSTPSTTTKPETSKPSTTTHTHSYSNATCTAPAKCSCGATNGSALGHSYSNATCTEAKKCSRCGTTSGSALGHSYSNGVCSRCGGKDSNYVKPVLVYQDSRVKIYYKQYTNNGVVFEVENLTNINITIQADTIALNYRSTDNITMSDDVAPYSIGEVVARCSISNVGNIGVISGQLRIIDFNDSFRTYDAKFVNVVVNSSVNVKQPTVSQPLVYSDSKVKIYYKEMNGSGVVFTVENLTNVVITIQADSVSINKRSADNITMSDDVSPHSTGDVVVRCSFGSVPTVELVGGQLRIIDFNDSFRTYYATFYNVAV